jgi:hypothetical protein
VLVSPQAWSFVYSQEVLLNTFSAVRIILRDGCCYLLPTPTWRAESDEASNKEAMKKTVQVELNKQRHS